MGLILGLEYMPKQDTFFGVELRTRYGYYSFDDGTRWTEDKNGELRPPVNWGGARLEYTLFSPQIGIVPKLYFHFDEEISLFLENEVAAGLMAGRFKYNDDTPHAEKRFTESTFSYNVGAGVELKREKWALAGSVGYSTLNFRGKIKKHQPRDSQGYIPDQNPVFYVTVVFKVYL